MCNSIGNIRICQNAAFLQSRHIVDILFGTGCNLHHSLQCFHRIITGSSFTGKHDGTGSVVDSICYIRCLRTGRTRVFHHGIQHLCRCDNLFSCFVYFFDQDFLDNRYILHRNLYSHVTTCYHDAIRYPYNIIDVIHTLFILNFSNNIDTLAVMFFQNLTDLQNVIGSSGEGCCNKIKSILDTKHNVAVICLTDKRHREFHVRHIDPFFVRDHTTVDYLTDNICSIQANNFHFDQTVIDQNTITSFDIIVKILICDGNTTGITDKITKCQCK